MSQSNSDSWVTANVIGVEEARVRIDAAVRPHLERQKLVDRDGEVRGGKCDGLIVLDQMGGGKRDRAEAPNAQVTIGPEPIWSAYPFVVSTRERW
jgi:hypothetical protein